MSTNWQGVTFPQQRITPSDDALIRRAMLLDCTLTGCEISYSGSTLTMSAGHLMICGRQIRHPVSQNFAIVDAKSGYARVVLTVDLTQTSTKESFDQVSSEIQYATSAGGFPQLEQSDINTTGSKYQVCLVVVSLGSGGITGIVSRIDTIDRTLDKALRSHDPQRLWTNPASWNPFEPQTLNLPQLSNYRLLMVDSAWSNDPKYGGATKAPMAVFPIIAGYEYSIQMFKIDPFFFVSRVLTFGDSSVTFRSAYGSNLQGTDPSGKDNSRLIPIVIYGIK